MGPGYPLIYPEVYLFLVGPLHFFGLQVKHLAVIHHTSQSHSSHSQPHPHTGVLIVPPAAAAADAAATEGEDHCEGEWEYDKSDSLEGGLILVDLFAVVHGSLRGRGILGELIGTAAMREAGFPVGVGWWVEGAVMKVNGVVAVGVEGEEATWPVEVESFNTSGVAWGRYDCGDEKQEEY